MMAKSRSAIPVSYSPSLPSGWELVLPAEKRSPSRFTRTEAAWLVLVLGITLFALVLG